MSRPSPLRSSGSPDLSVEEMQRYARHLILPEVGVEGQRRLKAARVSRRRGGGLGSPAALYLAARASAFWASWIPTSSNSPICSVRFSTPRVRSAGPSWRRPRSGLHDVNPGSGARAPRRAPDERQRAGDSRALRRRAGRQRQLPDALSRQRRVCPCSASRTCTAASSASTARRRCFWAERGPCYRCLYQEPPPPELVPSCAEGGVLGVLPGIVGSLQRSRR